MLNKYYAVPDKLPLIASVIDLKAESHDKYVERKITWSVKQHLEKGSGLSIDSIRRVAALNAVKVREKKN